MGQYYLTIFLAEKQGDKEVVRAYMCAHDFCNGVKLMEHSYMNNRFMRAVEYQLSPDGYFTNTRLVWAGDYADPEPDCKDNLEHIAQQNENKHFFTDAPADSYYRYILNHSKQQYVDKGPKSDKGFVIHPLSLLTSEGNGAGGGDYRGKNEGMCGIWSRDIISMDNEVPEGYTELFCDFDEN